MLKQFSQDICRSPLHNEIKAVMDGDTYKLELNFAPLGLDRHGEYFDTQTKTWFEPGDTRPHIHFHGLTDDMEFAEEPFRFKNNIKFLRIDEYGSWGETVLDPTSPFEMDHWKDVKAGKVFASSDAPPHLIRKYPSGRLKIWPITAVSSFTLGGRKIPANPRAIALPMKISYDFSELPDAFTEGSDLPSEAGKKSDKGEIQMLTKEEIAAAVQAGMKSSFDAQANLKVEQDKAEVNSLKDGLKFLGFDLDEAGVKVLLEADEETRINAMKTITSPKFSTLGSGGKPEDGPVDSFNHYMKTADAAPAIEDGLAFDLKDSQEEGKKALLGATIATGAITIPPLYLKGVDEYLKENSIIRKMGSKGQKTNGDEFIVHMESSVQSVYSINMGEDDTAATEDDPNLAGKVGRMYDYDKMVRVKNKYVNNTSGANLGQFVVDALAGMWAETENSILCTGTGLNQPQSIFAGGSLGVTAAATGTVTPAELSQHYYKLPGVFRRKKNVAWVMSDTMEGIIRSLRDTSNWAFLPLPSGGPQELDWDNLMGKTMFTSGYVPDPATAIKSLAVVNFEKGYVYAEGEQSGIAVSKEAYFAKRQTAYLGFNSFGAMVKHAAAVQYLLQA